MYSYYTMTIKMYICGCVRNNGKYLEQVFQNIDKIIGEIDDYHIIMSYDSSHDNSLEILRRKLQHYGAKNMSIIEGDENSLSSIRTQNIAKARNRILDKIRQLKVVAAFAEFAYFLMMDMDDICATPINMEGLCHIFEKERTEPLPWDAVSFHRDDYYDIWALSIHPFSFSCWHYPSGLKVVQTMKKYITRILNQTSNKDALLPCISAFNGLAVYRCSHFLNVHYEWDLEKTLEIIPRSYVETMTQKLHERPIFHHEECEHRFFHIRASQLNEARIRISPMKLFP